MHQNQITVQISGAIQCAWIMDAGCIRWQRYLPRLAVQRLLAATLAELLEFETVRGVATILGCDVVAFLAHGACQCDTWTNVGALTCHLVHLYG